MTKRQEKILFWIVEEFIKTSIPVSSTNLQRETSIDCCSSTVRNEMIVLEKLEMIEKLHSASGRVPTTKGYRYYLENSKQDKKFAGLKFSIDEIFKNRAASIESVVEQACYLISDVLQLPIAIFKNTSHNETKKLQAIQLIKLQDKKCMLILIANNDVLVEKIITLENDLIIDLQLSVDIISKRLFNSPLSEIKNRLDSLIPLLVKSIGSFEGKLKSLVIEVFKRALMSVNVYGTSNMLTTPELSNPSILQSIVSLLDKKNIWKLLSNEFLPLESREGTELGFMKNNELSVVSVGMKENLTLAIVGPKRVDYTKILNALDLVKRNLEENKRLLSTQRVNIEDKNSEVHNASKANENKKDTSVNYKEQLEKLQIEFDKFKETSKVEKEKVLFEVESWRKKYEEFAKIMEKRFNEKKVELEEKLVKEINFEKERVSKELKNSRSIALSNVFGDICENVLNISGRVLVLPETSSPDLINYSKGFQMIIESLKKIMIDNGLKIIKPKLNDAFDPSKHHAITQVERKDAPADGVIIEIVSPQYCLNNNTISYAKVKVAIKGQ